MIERIRWRSFGRALDVGCGEGRFCRMMQALEISTVGVDPTRALTDRARLLDPLGEYRIGCAAFSQSGTGYASTTGIARSAIS